MSVSAVVRSRAAVASAAAVAALGLGSAEAAADWSRGPDMLSARYGHTASLLPNGKALAAGGWGGSGTSELYDPATNTWSSAGGLAEGRFRHTATLLSNGKVLVTGGVSADDQASQRTSAELYDPATNQWSPTGSMAVARWLHQATRLPDGRVIVTGGFGGATAASSAEIYDPASGTWSTAASMAADHTPHNATLLSNGKVLVTGGFGTSTATTAEVYDPAANAWSATGPMMEVRQYSSATALPDGRVLVAGGGPSTFEPKASTELYDPSTNAWSNGPGMTNLRNRHTATALPDGRVIVAPGASEIFNPASGQWSPAGVVQTGQEHAAVLLADGRVLATGGSGAGARAELYADPAPTIIEPPPPPPPDLQAPRAVAGGARAQKAGRTVIVTITCGTVEDCIVSAKGSLSVPGVARVFKLGSVKPRDVPRGKRTILKLKVPARARKAALKALRGRKKVRASVAVTVADAAGNARSLKRTVSLRR